MLFAVSLTILLASCASSSGPVYSKAESSEAAAAAKAKKPSEPSRHPAPERNDSHRGDRGDSEEKKTGGDFFIFAKDTESEAPTGTLVLAGLEPNSSVYIDGARSYGRTLTLDIGSHELRVSRFGYLDFETTVSVPLGQTSSLQVDYLAAPFAIRGLDASPASFDPAEPGFLGSCDAIVSVSAPGDGKASVRDEGGRVLRDLGPVAFWGPSVKLRWDGRDDSGTALPNGDYLIHVEGSGSDGASDSADAKVTLASGLLSRWTPLYSGVSGALFAPDARTLAAWKFETAAGAELHLAPRGDIMSGLTTAHAGLRLGLPSSSGGSELDFSCMNVLWQGSPDANSYSLTGAWKRSLGGASQASSGGAAFYVKATLARYFGEDAESPIVPPWDGASRFTGLSAGLPLEYASGLFRAFATPEIEISDYYPNWLDDGRWATPGLFSWAYLRLGLEATLGRCTLGLSGVLRSAPFGGRLELAGPYPIGFEARWYSPSSPLVLSFVATGEVEDLSSYYFGAGLDIGFRL